MWRAGRALVVWAGLAWAACTGAPTPGVGPAPRSVQPSSAPAGSPVTIDVGGDFEAAVHVDYGAQGGSRIDAVFLVRLDTTDLGPVVFVDAHTLRANVPPSLMPGLYAVYVTDPAGRTGELPGAFTITPAPAARIAVTEMPDGTLEVGDRTLAVGQSLVLYASAFDASGTFAGLVDATWTVTNPAVAGVAPAVGPSTQFTATAMGTAAVTATTAAGLTDSTGTLTLGGCTSSCAALGVECGVVADPCGGTLDCGGCVAPRTCGGDALATPNRCGTSGMVRVPAGVFQMGCNAAIDSACQPGENPYHAVTVSTFEIDRTEVTQVAYSACVAARACGRPASLYDPVGTASYPVVEVLWQDAAAYCVWAGKRMPTEAEWEKAARGADGRLYPWGNSPPNCTLATYDACSTWAQPVGSHPAGASPYGALDMAGNASEWVADWYDAAYYAASPATDPSGPATGTTRVVRGQPAAPTGADLRVSARFGRDPATVDTQRGFRCASSGP